MATVIFVALLEQEKRSPCLTDSKTTSKHQLKKNPMGSLILKHRVVLMFNWNTVMRQ